MGHNDTASGTATTAVGYGNTASKNNATAVGSENTASGLQSTALGYRAKATADYAAAVGVNATAAGTRSIALGESANAAASNALALGSSAGVGSATTSNGQIAIGAQSGQRVNGVNNIAMGFQTGQDIGSFGVSSSAGNNNIALGTRSGRSVNGSRNVVSGWESGQTVVGNNNLVTGAQAGNNVSGNFNSANGYYAGTGVQGNYNVSSGSGAGANVHGSNNIAIGNRAGTLSTVIESPFNAQPLVIDSTALLADDTVALGTQAVATADSGTAIGNGAKASAENAFAGGTGATAAAVDAVAIGTDAQALGDSSIAVGRGAIATGSIAVGAAAQAGNGGAAFGDGAVATYNGGVNDPAIVAGAALGENAQADVSGATAAGTNSSVTVADGVALGSGSVASVAGGAAGYNPTGASAAEIAAIQATNSTTLGAVSVGTGAAGGNRQITNVAAGTNDSDAVNVAQLSALADTVESSATHFYSVNATSGGNYNNDGATGANSMAAGVNAVAQGTGALSVGNNNSVLGADAASANSAAFGANNVVANSQRTAAIGVANNVSASQDSGVFGGANMMTGAQDSVQIGNENQMQAAQAVAQIGGLNVATNAGASSMIGIGNALNNATASSITGIQNMVSDTTQANATGVENTISGGTQNSVIGSNNTLTDGTQNFVGGFANTLGTGLNGNQILASGGTVADTTSGGVLIGTGGALGANDAVAIGTGANAGHAGAVALGSGSVTADAVGTSGGTVAGTAYTYAGATPASTVSVGAAGAERTITNVAAGRVEAASTDAINGSQLYATNQEVGKNATNIATNTTNIATNTANIATNTTNIANADQQAVKYDWTDADGDGVVDPGEVNYNNITLAGDPATGTTITNVAAGEVAADSKDAVNGSQLFETNTNVTNLGNSVTNLTNNVANGTIGPVQQTGNANQLALVAPGGSGAAPGAPQQLTNVAAGVADTDAVNVSQLSAVGNTANAVSDTAVKYDWTDADGDGVVDPGEVNYNNVTLAGDPATGTTITNVAAGEVAADSKDAVNGSQLHDVSQSIATNLGGGSTVNGDGTVGAPTYVIHNAGDTVNTSNYNNVGDALTALDQGVVNNTTAITNIQNGAGIKYFHANSTLADSQAVGTDSVAIGPNAVANNAGDVALGSGSTTGDTTQTGGVTIAGTDYTFAGAAPVSTVSVGAAGAERTITNVAAGQVTETSTDAINGSQLFASNQAIEAVAQTAGATDQTAVKYEWTDTDGDGVVDPGEVNYDNVTLAGDPATGTTLTNVAAGEVAADSKDAVNGSQLFETNTNVTNLGNSVTNLTNNVTNGTIGPVQQTGNANQLALVAPGGSGAAPGDAQTLTNVAAGALDATSTEAVNGSQLFATNQAVDAASQTAVKYDWTDANNNGVVDPGEVNYNNITLAGGPEGTTITNVANGVNASDAVNYGQLQAAVGSVSVGFAGNAGAAVTRTSGQVLTIQGEATTAGTYSGGNIRTETDAATGAVNIQMADSPTFGNVTVNADGTGKITGVTAGTLSTTSKDAVNGSQLVALGDSMAASLSPGSSYDPATNAVNTQIVVGGSVYNNVESAIQAVNTTASAGWNVTTASTGTGVSTGSASANVAAGATATFTAGNNVMINQNGTEVQVALNPNLTGVESIAVAGGPTINGNGIDMGGDRITNVGAGVAPTDAVNMGQFNAGLSNTLNQANMYTDNAIADVRFDLSQYRRDANGGTASAMAMGTVPQAFEPGMGIMGFGVAHWQGEQAFAIGFSKASDDGRVIIRASGTYNTRRQAGAAVGVGVQF